MATPQRAPNPFYRGTRGRLFSLCIVSLILNVVFSLALIIRTVYPSQQDFYVTTVAGKAKSVTALGIPNQSDSAVKQWANQAATAIFTYNWVEYNQQLLRARQFFTTDGWQQFVDAVSNSNLLTTVVGKKLRVAAVATRPPIVLEKGPLLGKYTWRVQMPLLVTYTSASETSQQKLVVDMLITRVPTTQSVRGIGIAQFRMGY